MTRSIVPAAVRKRDVLVAVCGKCDGDGKSLRRTLKGELKRRGRSKAVRVVVSSCLDICPKRAVAIAISDRRGVAGVRYFVVDERNANAGELVDLLA